MSVSVLPVFDLHKKMVAPRTDGAYNSMLLVGAE